MNGSALPPPPPGSPVVAKAERPWSGRRWWRPVALAAVLVGLAAVLIAWWAGSFWGSVRDQAEVMLFLFAIGPVGLMAAMLGSASLFLGGLMLAVAERTKWPGVAVIITATGWSVFWIVWAIRVMWPSGGPPG